MFRIAVCDDEESYRKKVIECLHAEKSIENQIEIYEYADGKELISDIGKCHDLIFLDIQMPGIDGDEAAKMLRNWNKNAILVFCTNVKKIVPETIKVQPFRYIIKDIRDNMLKEELPCIIDEMIQKKCDDEITITGDGVLYKIAANDILYIAVRKRGTKVFVYRGRKIEEILCRTSLGEMYKEVKTKGFEYAHNSYIVNMANITKLKNNIITLKGTIELNVSRSKKKQFDESFAEFLHTRYKRK